MRSIQRRSTSLLFAAIAGVVLLFAMLFMGMSRVQAEDEQSTGRLITIHDRGSETVMLSDAETVAGVLETAGVEIDARDAVEPALTEKLVANEYSINIYRARPVTIIDGVLRQKIITPYQTGEQIAKDGGVNLFTEDDTILTRSNDILNDGAGLRLVVDRATPLTLDLFGTKTAIRTQAETVEEMLSDKDITLEANDRVSVSQSTPIVEAMTVKIWREGKQTVTAEEKVDFPVEIIQDADRPIGYSAVQTKGVQGLRTVTYEVDIKNGQEVARKEIAALVTKKPVKQVEIVGIKINLSVNYSADRAEIMTAAGVAQSDQDYAAYIINNENALWCPIRWQGTTGCGDTYYEKFPGAESSSQVGYGLCQATPGIKMASAGGDWRTNVITQMKWCRDYAIGRYGSWEAAYRFKVTSGWW